MQQVPPVNPEPVDVPASEAAGEIWVDPIHREMNPDRLPDEPEPDPNAEPEPAAEAEPAGEGEGEGAEQKAKDELTPEQLKGVLDEDETDEDAEPDADGEDADARDRKGRKAQRHTSRDARRERREQARRIAAMEAEIAALKAEKQAAAQADAGAEAETETPATPPKLEDFDDADEWSQAFSEWTQDQLNAGKEAARKAEEAKAAEAETKRKQDAWNAFREREEAARDAIEDYDDLVYDETLPIQLSDTAIDLIIESERGPELIYWLCQHQDEAAKLAEMSDVQLARALGRIEATLPALPSADDDEPEPDDGQDAEEAEKAAAEKASASNPQPQPQPRRTPTQAPEPVPTITGGGAPPVRDPSKMDFHEYEEGRRTGKIR